MKAIVIKQPFANLILQHEKTIELRTFNTSHRGDLLIVAAKKDHAGNVLISFHDEACEWTSKEHLGFWEDHDEVFLRGHAICVVTVTDSRPMTLDDEQPACHRVFPNAKAWPLENLSLSSKDLAFISSSLNFLILDSRALIVSTNGLSFSISFWLESKNLEKNGIIQNYSTTKNQNPEPLKVQGLGSFFLLQEKIILLLFLFLFGCHVTPHLLAKINKFVSIFLLLTSLNIFFNLSRKILASEM